ncbi:unnamed protein product [Nezara viridula]|uniref:Peregrin n=1 Tax=Nezara viridula TaxID=85310 RepID=A0A9P0GYR8_NEZVI|nr:unnamed protein product [Nezara viridula]
MALDFDVLEYCRKLRTSKQPPYTCPIVECSKTYKSMCGLQYHLVNFDHNNCKDDSPAVQKATPQETPARKSKKKKGRTHNTPTVKTQTPTRQPLSYSEAQKYVEFEVDDKIHRLLIDEVIPVISRHNYELYRPKGSSSSSCKNVIKLPDLSKLPQPKFRIIDDYNIPDAPPRPAGYIRFIEKSVEDMEGEVEYDMDEEDSAWLEIMNSKRAENGLADVTVDAFELLMDRLEKESFMQTSNKPGEGSAVIDDDAVCCICTDGECQNSNVILFCDMCNLAVHQDCYGVPYIPEGQWLCRRCLQSPSRAVDCVLCPNNGGAFKQTDRGHWAHVVCALWIPEVRFANTVFLEPIDSIETIPPARWKLTCYLCKQRGVGACIQCHKTNCYSAFHVTCAQQAGLYMKIDAVRDAQSTAAETENAPVLVHKIAYCGTHTPADAEKPKAKAQKKLLTKATSAPVISIPTIPPERIQEIGALVSMPKKNQFIQRLIAYWTLKRQMRNGVPLLRRLQTSHLSRRDNPSVFAHSVDDIAELKNQLKYWQCLRQDLERARLLCELVRKREKLKRELVKVKAQCLEMELCPLVSFLRRLLDLIRARDTGEIFIEPVDQTEVPDYSDVVKNPMDLSTMRTKIDTFQYNTLQEFENDFYLMINNCLAYNSKDTVFYRAALKMRDQGGALLKQAHIDLEISGIDTGHISMPFPESEDNDSEQENTKDNSDGNEEEDSSEKITLLNKIEGLNAFDTELMKFTKDQCSMPRKEMSSRLNNLLELAQSVKHGNARSKRIKLIKTLKAKIPKIKRDKSASKEEDSFKTDAKSKKSDYVSTEEEECTSPKVEKRKRKRESKTSTPSPKENVDKGSSGNTASSGVNRRTAVLFTRKAAAALKKPNQSSSVRRRGRPSKNASSEPTESNCSSTLDSFSIYRSSETSVKSEESHSDDGSCCSGCSGSRSDSSSGSCSDWTESEEGSAQNTSMEALDQLQLVWAKCRGYPWYPALIINPKMPRGYVHNGVPIPSPPADVIALANNYTEPVYLVLFFDTKRTWQWLPRNKLEPLGITYELDHIKLTESRKPADRKAVKKAYQEAMAHRTQIDKKAESPKKI